MIVLGFYHFYPVAVAVAVVCEMVVVMMMVMIDDDEFEIGRYVHIPTGTMSVVALT